MRPGSSIQYSKRLVLDSAAVVRFENADNTQWLSEGYYYDEVSSVETRLEAETLVPGIDNLSINLFLGTSTKGDLNFDGSVDLMDAILGLQILTDDEPVTDISPAADVNADGVLGLPEVIHIMGQL